MAKNWSMKEAVAEILAGNKEAIQDIGKRFPLTANAIATMGNNAGAVAIINALPDHISARKIESVLKDGVADIEDDEIETPEDKPVVKKEEKPAKKTAAKKEAKNDEPELEMMTEVELFKLCKARKIKAAPKQDKQYYLDLLNPKTEDADDDWDDDAAEEKKPAKKAPAKKEAPKKETKKPVKKAVKEEESSDDDDDEDWDI